jgi:hypothetical protein
MADRDFFVKNGLVTGTNNVTIGNSVYIVAGGNVGIHNSSPAHDLSINGPTFFGGDIASSINLSANTTGVYHTGTINAASHTVGTSTIANATGVYTGVVNAASHTVGTAFTANATLTNTVSLVVSSNIATFGNTFYIVSNGNVGVGTATPNSRLTVLSTSSNLDFNAITGVYSSNQGPGGSGPGGAGVAGYNLNGYGVLGATSNGSGVIGVTNTGFGVAGITRLANSIAGYFGNESSGVGVKAVSNTGIPFVAANNTVDFMSILANGNVGIGNTAPADKLSVNGTTYLGGSITTANGTQITLGRQTTGGLEGAQIDWGSGNSACTAYPSWSTDVYTNQFRIFNGGVSNTQVSMSGTSTGVVGLYVQGNVSFGNTTSNAGLLVYSAANNQNFNAITGVYSSNQGSGGSGTGGAGVAGYNLNGFGVLGATSNGIGVVGVTNTGIGVAGYSRLANSIAVYGENQSSGVGVHGKSTSGLPLLCQNNTSNVAYVDNAGNFVAYQNITAYASDERLKTNFVEIPNALEKVNQLSGYTFDWLTEKCDTLGFSPSLKHEHGLKAQEVQRVMEDAVCLAPFDRDLDNNQQSKSGEKYLTIRYERLIPLLIQAIKELKNEIDELKK